MSRLANSFSRLNAECLEGRDVPSAAVPLTGEEQLFLELINRGRANPAAEAARYGVDLNEGLAAGTISTAAKQPLAPQQNLLAAIRAHTADMLGRDYFDHTSPEGTTPWTRTKAAGYTGFATAENLASNYSPSPDQNAATTEKIYQQLFVDAGVSGRGHRVNLLKDATTEVGTAVTFGPADRGGFAEVIAGQDFGVSGSTRYLTGVAYTDAVVADRFYTVGEGVGGATITATADTGAVYATTTAAAGGYQLALPTGSYTVTATPAGGAAFSLGRVTMGSQNAKLDAIPPAAAAAVPVEAARPTPKVLAVGAGVGTGPTVKFYDPVTGQPQGQWSAYEAGFTGGVRVATADFTGDGYDDILVGPGPGRAPTIKVYDRVAGRVVREFAAFEAAFTGGVYVAAADITGDGKADAIVTPDEGGGPRVRVLNGGDFGTVADFFGIDDTKFRGGTRANVGDLNADGRADVIVAAGFQGGPRVAGFDGKTIAGGRPAKLFNDFYAFESSLRNGVYVTVGDIDGDGYAELVAGAGPGGGPRVIAFGGKELVANRQTPLADFFTGNTADRGGVRVTLEDGDGDGKADLVTGSGAGAGTRVTTYKASAVRGTTAPAAAFTMDAFPGAVGGVYVG